jgi:hypothetical protein
MLEEGTKVRVILEEPRDNVTDVTQTWRSVPWWVHRWASQLVPRSVPWYIGVRRSDSAVAGTLVDVAVGVK